MPKKATIKDYVEEIKKISDEELKELSEHGDSQATKILKNQKK